MDIWGLGDGDRGLAMAKLRVIDRLPVGPTRYHDHEPAEASERTGVRRSGAAATPEQVRRTIRACVNHSVWEFDREVLQLWRGSDEGPPSASEADMAFVKQLYYWCQGDQQLMDECFRASGRMRPKWDEVHSADGATYGKMTIRKVCRTNSDTFGGRYVEKG